MEASSPAVQPISLRSVEGRLSELRQTFAAAKPFPHVVIDDFLPPEVAVAACDELDRIDQVDFTKYLHVNERKFANTDPSTWGPVLSTVCERLQSTEFVTLLSQLTGIDGLIADHDLDGGGLHRSTRGGFLNVHADFTAHHQRPTWRRRVNLILYLNRTWDEQWGGALELWPTDMSRCSQRIVPVGNRAVIFATSDDSYHGHPDPMTCPEGTYRQSLALYYFTEETEKHVHSTNYRSRPGDGAKAIAIAADRVALRGYDVVKRRLRLSDGAASRWLGSFDRIRRRRG